MEDVIPSAGGLGDAFAEEEDVIAPGDRIGGATESKGPKLRFCPESNDILYPREDKQRRVLVYGCLSCSYEVMPFFMCTTGALVRACSQSLCRASTLYSFLGRCRSIE